MRLVRYYYDRLRHPLRYRLLDEYLPATRWSAAALALAQRRSFSAMVRFAFTQTDYYARCYAALGIDPSSDEDIDPCSLPVLEKAHLRDYRDRLLANGVAQCDARLGHTGGSTGSPLSFYYDTRKHELMLAGMKRGFMMSGWRPGERVLFLWGSPRDLRPGGIFAASAAGLLSCERAIGAAEFSESTLQAWVGLIRQWRPTLLYGYASVLDKLAGFILDQDLPPPALMRGVYATAEPLYPSQRECIGQAFDCRVFNQYGCREVPNIAWECRAGQMHVFSDMVCLETDNDAPHTDFLVTSLTNRLMPMIRYRLGDTGELLQDQCDCGLGFPLMRTDVCRHNDLICLPDGRTVHPSYFNGLMYGMPAVQEYQWIQVSPRALLLYLVGRGSPDSALGTGLQARIREDLGPDIDVALRWVGQIPRGPTGKHRFVIGLAVSGT